MAFNSCRRLNSNTSPLTADVLRITLIVVAIQAATYLWMAALDIKDMGFMIALREGDKS